MRPQAKAEGGKINWSENETVRGNLPDKPMPSGPRPGPKAPKTIQKKDGAKPVKLFKKGGSVRRGDGCCVKGGTKGRII